MGTFRTSPPRFYIPPTREEIRREAKKADLKHWSNDLVVDLCNLAAGGKINPPSTYREKVIQQATKRLPKPDSDGEWQLQNGNWTKNRQEAIEDMANKIMKYHQSVQDFLRTIKFHKVPGQTPLEKAVSLLKFLYNQGGEPGEDGEPLPIFQKKNGEEVGRNLNNLLDMIDSLDEAEKKLLKEKETNEDRDQTLQKRKLLEDMTREKEVWLKVSRLLDKKAQMCVSRSVKIVPSPDGDEVRTRPMKDLGELLKITKSSWALYRLQPTIFWYKAATKQFVVKERIKKKEKKQLLYIIIDCSGSMDDGERIAKAGGILFNRLKAVIKGEAEIYVRFFDSDLHEEFHASTASEAKELMGRFGEENFSGGSTEISACVRQAQKRIKEIVAEGQCERPELVVITDGDDSIDLTTKELRGTKMHAFVVERSNRRLTDLAVKTGGIGINNL